METDVKRMDVCYLHRWGNIKLLPIEGTSVELRCPHCEEQIYRVTQNREAAIGGGQWLTDGDTNPYLYQLLPGFPPRGFAEETLFGSHKACDGRYFVIEAYFADTDIESEPQVYFFQEHIDKPSARNFIANYQAHGSDIPSHWIVTQAPSPAGIIHRHLFGPFVVERYLWEYACVILLRLWPDLNLLIRESNRSMKIGHSSMV